jgi:CubicO group peptidase (beta-lactamase class C family)
LKRLLIMAVMVWAPQLAAQSFDGLGESLARGDYGNIKAVIISRHGEIIYEDYFRGAQPNDLHQVQSVTKSIGSALIGIAHRQGKIALDENLGHFFSDLYPMAQGAYRDKQAITVEQVLQQRHGIEWDESSVDYRNALNPVGQMVTSPDWYQYVLTRPTDAAPGSRFSYSSGASTLLSRIIRVATGMGPEAFAMQELFGPLGIGQMHWEVYSEEGLGHGLTDWPNPDHDPPLGFGLWLRARDLVKIGELYLGGGVYAGRRILDTAWVDASWVKYSHAGNSSFFSEPGWGHGYQWWIAKLTDPRNRPWHVFFASGWGSQVIFVLPELGLVVVTTADNYDYNGPDVDALLATRILPELNPRLDQRFNGAWYDPDADGQGLTLEIREDGVTAVSFWYTYDNQGNQRWFLLQGQVDDDAAEMTIYRTSGGLFLQGTPYTLDAWGSGRFTATDCDHITLQFDSDEASGTIPLTRLSGYCFNPPE